MLLDPWRERERVNWLPHQVLWVKAANSLPFFAREAAYRDIANMMGISQAKVMDKAWRVRIPGRPPRLMAAE